MIKLMPTSRLILTFALMSSFGNLASARGIGLILSGGLSKYQANVTQPGVNANLNGWGNTLAAGLDIPLSSTFGAFALGEYSQKDLRSTNTSSTYLDDTFVTGKGLRAGVTFSNFFLGGSYQLVGVDLKTVSSTNGAASTHLDLNGYSYFLGYDLPVNDTVSASLSGESTTFSTSGFAYTDYGVCLKLNIMLSGLFGH